MLILCSAILLSLFISSTSLCVCVCVEFLEFSVYVVLMSWDFPGKTKEGSLCTAVKQRQGLACGQVGQGGQGPADNLRSQEEWSRRRGLSLTLADGFCE